MEEADPMAVMISVKRPSRKRHVLSKNSFVDSESKILQNIQASSDSVYESKIKEEAEDDPSEANIIISDYEIFSEDIKDEVPGDGAKVKMRKAGEKVYPCEKCNLISQSSANFKKHVLTHSGEKPFKCDVCQKAFRQRHHLTDHQRTHTGERPFECEECGSRFVQKSSLNLHRKKHSGKKLYSCTMCDHSTYEKMHLKMHMRTHTGEKPYQCDKCGRTFSNSTRLKFHRMIHTGERRYKCEECGVCFREKVTLQKHKGVHINLGPFTCEECGKAFPRLAGLSLHRKIHVSKKDYLYVVKKEPHEPLKSTPSNASRETVIKKENIPVSEIMPIIGHEAENISNSTFNSQENAKVTEQISSALVSSEVPMPLINTECNQASIGEATDSHSSSVLGNNLIINNNVIHISEDDRSQNKLKENLACNISEENVPNVGNVLHPDQVRAALESGTVLETQGQDGKEFYIVLPPSLKNKEITYISDPAHASSSIMTVAQSAADVALDIQGPDNETSVECDSIKVLSDDDHNSFNDAYPNVVHELIENDICDYPGVLEEAHTVADSYSIQVQEEIHDFYQNHDATVSYPAKLTYYVPRYSEVVQEEIHPDGTSLVVCKEEPEYIREITYVIEEGTNNPIKIYTRDTKFCKDLRSSINKSKHKKKFKENEYRTDDTNLRKQKSDFRRPMSVKPKIREKKCKEKKPKTRKVYDCQQCGKVCKTSSNFISHMRTHSGERPYFCDLCGMGFKQVAHLRSHIRIHTGERPYICNICHATFTQSSRLNSHKKSKHAQNKILVKKEEKPLGDFKVRNFYCKFCKKTFINECFKKDHMKKHLSSQPYECKMCGLCYTRKSSMMKHNLKHADHKYICEICGSSFFQLSSLQNHRSVDHEEALTESGTSEVCSSVKTGDEKELISNPSINNNKNEASDGAKVREEIISETNANYSQVKEEVTDIMDEDVCVKSEVVSATDIGETPVKHEVTETTDMVKEGEGHLNEGNVSGVETKNDPSAILDSESLALHSTQPIKEEFSKIKTHPTYIDKIGRKIWACNVCDKPFLQSSNLHSHMRMHTGERPYKCNYCHHAFKQITHLKDHMGRHTGFKPYKCGECGSCFSQRSAVTRHIKNLHNDNAVVIRTIEPLSSECKSLTLIKSDSQSDDSQHSLPNGKINLRPYRKRKLNEDSNSNSETKTKICDICKRSYKLKYFRSHLRCHTGERPYKCSYCTEAFRQKAHLNSHELRHTGEKPFVCKHCGACFTQSFKCSTHMKKCMERENNIHTKSAKKYQSACGTSFRTYIQLAKHTKELRLIDNNEKSTDISDLDILLGEESESECNFKRRKMSVTNNDWNMTIKTAQSSQVSIDKAFTCNKCDMTFENFAKYKIHMQEHGNVLQICEDCGVVFRRASALQSHQRLKHRREDLSCKEYNYVDQEHIKENQLIKDVIVPIPLKEEERGSYDENKGKQTKGVEVNVKQECVNGKAGMEKGHIKEKVENPRRGSAVKNVKKAVSQVKLKVVKENNIESNNETLGASGRKRLGASGVLPGERLNTDSKKCDVDQHEVSQESYLCTACGKTFTRFSKLKHHIGMWCKGFSRHDTVSVSENNQLTQPFLQTSEIIKRKHNNETKSTEKDILLSDAVNAENSRCEGTSDILSCACQSDQIVAVNEEIKSEDDIILNEVKSTEL
ncbi:hypothetical protein OTU49_015859 [Cherax quadricarinatus]|uniref:Uncharacterized protein n=1 Tax=Cherax quadricarinatus TaxID=27406 RepID=A0AAW0Y984_CHEQU